MVLGPPPENCRCGNCRSEEEAEAKRCDTPSSDEVWLNRAFEDLRTGHKDGRLRVVTPRGSVEQDALQSINLYRQQKQQPIGPVVPILGLSFGGKIDNVAIEDLIGFCEDIIIVGHQHEWGARGTFHVESTMQVEAAEVPTYEITYEWDVIAHDGWR